MRIVLACLLLAAGSCAARADDTKPSAPPPAASVAAPASAAPAPAADAGPRLSDFADLVVAGIVGENAPEVQADFASGAALGSMPLIFEKTRLADIQSTFGGQPHTQGDTGNAADWLCYTQHARTRAETPQTVWFIADNQAAGDTLSLVVVENVDASKASGCTTAPKTFVFPTFAVPSIGASLADIKAKFGALTRDRQHNVYYNSTRALNDGSGASVYQTLGYVMNKKGTAIGIAVGQLTTH